jgi:hypothetical protein
MKLTTYINGTTAKMHNRRIHVGNRARGTLISFQRYGKDTKPSYWYKFKRGIHTLDIILSPEAVDLLYASLHKAIAARKIQQRCDHIGEEVCKKCGLNLAD